MTTVSRALGGYSDVSEKTRKKVKFYAKKYNYNPSPYASRLASGKSNTVGVVIPLYGINSSFLNQSHFFQFIAGMSHKINMENMQFTVLFANSKNEEINAYEKLINVQKVDRIIIHNTKKNDHRIKLFKKNKVDFVSWGRSNDKENSYSWIDLDNELSSKIIVDYLVSKGHSNIAYLNIIEKYNFASQRKTGFLKALKKNNIPFNKNYYASVKYEEPELHKYVIKKMLLKFSKITSIVCSSEYSAVGAISAVKDLNLKIGKDISIIGYDGPVISSFATPGITAVSHPIMEIGGKAIEMLFLQEKDKKHRNFLVKPYIIERGSVHTVKKIQ